MPPSKKKPGGGSPAKRKKAASSSAAAGTSAEPITVDSVLAAKSHFSVLKLKPPNPKHKSIKDAFKHACLRVHPDKVSDPRAAEAFVKLKEAHRVLVDPLLREQYNEELKVAKLRRAAGHSSALRAAEEAAEASVFRTMNQDLARERRAEQEAEEQRQRDEARREKREKAEQARKAEQQIREARRAERQIEQQKRDAEERAAAAQERVAAAKKKTQKANQATAMREVSQAKQSAAAAKAAADKKAFAARRQRKQQRHAAMQADLNLERVRQPRDDEPSSSQQPQQQQPKKPVDLSLGSAVPLPQSDYGISGAAGPSDYASDASSSFSHPPPPQHQPPPQPPPPPPAVTGSVASSIGAARRARQAARQAARQGGLGAASQPPPPQQPPPPRQKQQQEEVDDAATATSPDAGSSSESSPEQQGGLVGSPTAHGLLPKDGAAIPSRGSRVEGADGATWAELSPKWLQWVLGSPSRNMEPEEGFSPAATTEGEAHSDSPAESEPRQEATTTVEAAELHGEAAA